jgi:hypothetical protein
MKARQRVQNGGLQGGERCKPGPFSLGWDDFDACRSFAVNVRAQYNDICANELRVRNQPIK